MALKPYLLSGVVAVSQSLLMICSLFTCLQAADRDPLQDFCVGLGLNNKLVAQAPSRSHGIARPQARRSEGWLLGGNTPFATDPSLALSLALSGLAQYLSTRQLAASYRSTSATSLLVADVTNNNNMQMTAQLASDGLPCKAASDVESADFASSHLRTARLQSQQLGMAVSLADAAAFPGLNTQGISMARIEFQPRGLNPPHVHPRATEMLFLIEGTLVVGFVTTANTLFQQTLRQGDVFVFPRGLPQFQFNPDESESALAIAAFNSQNPGYSRLISFLFAAQPPLPDEVLQTALGIDDQLDIDRLVASVARALE